MDNLEEMDKFLEMYTLPWLNQEEIENWVLKVLTRDFPGGPVVKTSPSNAGGAGSIPGRQAKIPHASGPKSQNIKQKQYCRKINKDFKNGQYQKNL